jgi:hypothetical protein
LAGNKAAVFSDCDSVSAFRKTNGFTTTESALDCPMLSAANSIKITEKQIFMHCIKGSFDCKFTAWSTPYFINVF